MTATTHTFFFACLKRDIHHGQTLTGGDTSTTLKAVAPVKAQAVTQAISLADAQAVTQAISLADAQAVPQAISLADAQAVPQATRSSRHLSPGLLRPGITDGCAGGQGRNDGRTGANGGGTGDRSTRAGHGAGNGSKDGRSASAGSGHKACFLSNDANRR
jgi:hypothetical protein